MMTIETELNRQENVFIIGARSQSEEAKELTEHLNELSELVETYGAVVKGRYECCVRKPTAATLLSKGLLEKAGQLIENTNVDTIVFDNDLTPGQQRNLESFFGKTVMDRSEVILYIFSDRAKSKEATLQVELAQAKYQRPRLKRLWTHLHRQKGGGVNMKGEGEKQIELDRRMIDHRIKTLQSHLKDVETQREVQQKQRIESYIPRVAIVGYTNSGKSTLLNALTDSGVLAEDKLFATLDTTTRKCKLGSSQDFLLTDTVGFIRKLPHHLVESFKSTLKESVESDYIIHVIDISSMDMDDKIQTTNDVISQLTKEKPQELMVFNKVDLIDSSRLKLMKMRFPDAVFISLAETIGMDRFQEKLIEMISTFYIHAKLTLPHNKQKLVSEIHEHSNVINVTYDEDGTHMECLFPKHLKYELEQYIIEK